jgi:putative flippase GtrA
MPQINYHSAKRLHRSLFIDHTDHGMVQLFRYGFVGGFSAIVDIVSFYLLTAEAHIYYLISIFFAFILGTIVNYMLSITWIFKSSGNFKSEFTLFTLIGVVGLGLTELIVWFLVSQFHFFYLTAKLFALVIVMLWSFSLRKILFNRLQKQHANTIIVEASNNSY